MVECVLVQWESHHIVIVIVSEFQLFCIFDLHHLLYHVVEPLLACK